jgi:lipoprotein-anchoring transpeptidase ErfK/SrfK
MLPGTVLAASPPFKPYWVQNFRETELWSGPTGAAVDYGPVPQWSYLQVMQPQAGPRLYVLVPWTKNYAYVDATSVGPSGAPPADWLSLVTNATPVAADSTSWVGQVIGTGVYARTEPSVTAPIKQTLPPGTIVQVVAWVAGDPVSYGNWTWAKFADGTYGYSTSLQAIPPKTPPAPPVDHPSGKWVDVNLLHQVAVAYQDNTPVHLALVSTGSPGWETPVGLHYIWRRVADETMTSSSLSHLGLDATQLAQANYDLSGVLDTQYFDNVGDALHDNYWLPASEFGQPHSHGCVGMPLADAQWFWDWAGVGVPVVVQAN